MQGRKNYQEKLFMSFQLSDHVPEDNFYRRLRDLLSLDFLYKSTAPYYGREGQKSIDPVVFFKLLLVGYLENQPSDRRIINTASMRLDIRYFIGYDLDEELPWHSTLSRTRQLYDEDVFDSLFRQVLRQCIENGMVSGKRQAVDSVLVRANAAMDSVKEREIMDDAALFARELEKNGECRATVKPSNKTRISRTDPDSRMATKSGKPTQLCYLGQLSVDASGHVITHIQAFHADKRDSQCLDTVVSKAADNLSEGHLQVREVVADTNYSSAEALTSLTRRNIRGFIPNTGTYKAEREGFTFDPANDRYLCRSGKTLGFKGYRNHHGISKVYMSNVTDCRSCPFKSTCIGKSRQKMITNSLSKPLFDEMHLRINSPQGKKMMAVRKSTVEPVIGTLVEYLGMKKVYTKGIKQANKCMLMAGLCYNIRKLMKHTAKRTKNQAENIKCAITASATLVFRTTFSNKQTHLDRQRSIPTIA